MKVIREPISRGLRARVMERDNFRCRRCGCGPNDRKLHVDHIVPVAQGGRSVDWNLQTLCESCNGGKLARDPHTHDTHRSPPADARVGAMVAGSQQDAIASSAQHSLVGMYCHKTSNDPDLTKAGWNWQYQCRVEAVLGESVMLQYFSAFDGCATNIKPIPLSELLDGTWIFYASHDAWVEAGDQAMARLWTEHDREHDAFERAVARACDCGRTAKEWHRDGCASFAERRRLCDQKAEGRSGG